MKKLGIYAFYDKDGIVDRYVLYFLNSIREYLDELIIVVNGKLDFKGELELKKYVDKIIIRENTGYDVMAIRSILVDYYKWVGLFQYDRIVIMNDTFFGPFYPMESIFAKLEEDVDLWGMLARINGETEYSKVTTVDSFFYSMSNKLIKSENWKEFWVDMEADKWTFQEVLENYENRLVFECEKSGCTWDAYLRSDNKAYKRKESSYGDYRNLSYELIKHYHYPLLKRKPVSLAPNFYFTDSKTLKDAISYIDRETEYDISMIWENILRVYNIADIKNALQLVKIFDGKCKDDFEKRDLSCIAIILKTEQPDWVEEYIKSIKKNNIIQFYVFTENNVINTVLKYELENRYFNIEISYNLSVQAYIKKIRDISKEYGIILYIDDSNLVNQRNPILVGRVCQNLIFENMWKDINNIQEVREEFKTCPYLGVGILPPMIHSQYMNAFQNDWENFYEEIHNKILLINSYIILNEQKDCINRWPVFWVRGIILEKVCDIIYEDSKKYSYEIIAELLGRMVPYVAQGMGFYTEEFLDINSAEVYHSNLEYLIKELLRKNMIQGNKINEFRDFRYVGMNEFCYRNKEIYIYGAGIIGKAVLKRLREMNIKNIIGFIVSDGYRKSNKLEDYPIYELHEIEKNSDTGIIVAISGQQSQISTNLKNKGIEKIYLV